MMGWEGDEPEGAFDSVVACVTSYGLEGIRQWHVYGLDQLDAARACYEKLEVKRHARASKTPRRGARTA
jgi:hypothetical protein